MKSEEAFHEVKPNWQVTAMTIDCQTVGHETTLIVDKDWTVSCTYHRRWGPVRIERRTGLSRLPALLGIGSDEKLLSSDCPGPEACSFANDYRSKLYQEEAAQIA